MRHRDNRARALPASITSDIRRIARELKAGRQLPDATVLQAQVSSSRALRTDDTAPHSVTIANDRGSELACRVLSLPIEEPGNPRRQRKARLLEMLADLQDVATRGGVNSATLADMFDQLEAAVDEISSCT